MSLRTDWHSTASVLICWGQAVAFAPGDRVPDKFIRTGLVPTSAVTFDPSHFPSWDSVSARTWDSLWVWSNPDVYDNH